MKWGIVSIVSGLAIRDGSACGHPGQLMRQTDRPRDQDENTNRFKVAKRSTLLPNSITSSSA
jgi:hypothetical protein